MQIAHCTGYVVRNYEHIMQIAHCKGYVAAMNVCRLVT